MQILIDDSSLRSGHADRGIGTYTRQLIKQLQQLHSLSVHTGDWKQLWKTVDLVHVPQIDFFNPTLPRINKPLVVTIHDVIPLQFPKEYPVGKRGKLHLWRQKRALRRAAAIITDSCASKEGILEHLRVPASRIFVIPLAADYELVAPSHETQNKVVQKYHLPEKYILYVGDINYNKNLYQLIKALKFVDDRIHLILLGRNFRVQSIPEWKAIEQQVALSNVPDRVMYISDIQTGDVATLASIYSRSLCYVQPSLAEGFGLPVLEAMQIGTPVIASNRTSLPEVGGAAAHYVEPNAESFARAITEISNYDHAKRTTVIEAGKRHASRFSWENTARMTAAVYQHILKIE